MIKTVFEKAMRILRATPLLGVICRRMGKGPPGPAPTAIRGMPIRRDPRRSMHILDLRRLIMLSVLGVLASLSVTASASAATFFSNPTPMKIPASSGAASGPPTPFPSQIAVSSLVGPISDVNVTLQGVGHTWPDALDILLVSPSGDKVMLMSDACGEDDIEDFNWTFSQQAPRVMSSDSSDCGESVFRPTNYDDPAGCFLGNDFSGFFNEYLKPPHGASLDNFNNENPNGIWKLYINDDCDGNPNSNTGDIELGWALGIETGPVDVAIPGSGTSGPASHYPATRTISGETGIISDLDVSIDGIFHERPEDLDLLLVGPQGQKVIVMSDACGPLGVNAYGWEWDDEAAAPMPEGSGTDVCGTRLHRPANYGFGDVWPAPAPAGPYSTSLSAFDGTDPNGEWRLFVVDDAAGATGFFTNRFQLGITTGPGPDTTAPAVESAAPTGTNVPPNANLRAVFSETMDGATITRSTFTLVKKGTIKRVAATVSYDAATTKAILNPTNNLRRGVAYKATVTTGAKDLAGNALDQNPSVTDDQQKVWFFKTRN